MIDWVFRECYDRALIESGLHNRDEQSGPNHTGSLGFCFTSLIGFPGDSMSLQ